MDDKIYYVNAKNKSAFLEVDQCLSRLLSEFHYSEKNGPVFICIGSDRVTGDSLGPMIGSELSQKLSPDFPVYGTLHEPLHALNLNALLPELKERYKNRILVAIDASLGTKEHQGYITLGKGCLSPGAGVNKILDSVGDLFITGIIGTSGPFSHFSLQTARLSSVMNMAHPICEGILRCCQRSAYASREKEAVR